MGDTKNRLKPDIIVKNYWSSNEEFADLFNAVLFGGKQVIKSYELNDVDTDVSNVEKYGTYTESIKAIRDNIKIRKKSTISGIEFVLLGIEGQEHIHYAMPLRIMGYDYGSYRKQYSDIKKEIKKKKGLTTDEFLSGMKKEDRFIPVVTIVVYYGEKEWDGALSLKQMMTIPKEMENIVNDYKMKLVEARQNDLLFYNVNNRDLFNLFGILLNKDKNTRELREEAIKYSVDHKVDRNIINTVAGAARCDLDFDDLFKEGDSMWRVFEETRDEGKIEGKIEGQIEAYNDCNMPIAEIAKKVSKSEEYVKEVIKKLSAACL